MAGRNPEMLSACAVCGEKSNLKRYARCQQVCYCSRDHQAKHWKIHKKQCATKNAKNEDEQQNLGSNSSQLKTKNEDHPRSMDETRYETESNTEKLKFDTRPLQLLSENDCTPETYDTESIAQRIVNQLNSKGFSVVDGYFDKSHLLCVLQEIKLLEKSGVFKQGQLAGGRTSGDNSKKMQKSSIRNDFITWLQGNETESYPEICKVVSKMDELLSCINDNIEEFAIGGRTKAMIACYPGSGSGYARHVDNPTKDGRIITCICYLNEGWDVHTQGGVLRIFSEEDYVDVAPVMNRLLLFWSDRRTPHEVQAAFDKRYAITVWYFDQEERAKAKQEETENEISKIHGEIQMMEIQTKKIEKDNLQCKIENESSKAVGGLTTEELEAIKLLIGNHPDPRGVLSKLGIASSIQNSLLKTIGMMDKT